MAVRCCTSTWYNIEQKLWELFDYRFCINLNMASVAILDLKNVASVHVAVGLFLEDKNSEAMVKIL